MERYELANGKVYDIIRRPDKCTVVSNGSMVYSGTYAGCRRYIESMKLTRRHGGMIDQKLTLKAEEILEGMKREAVDMIRRTDIQETRKAWYHSHLGSIDFARQMGLITEERRKQLYEEFKECIKQEPGETHEREEK